MNMMIAFQLKQHVFFLVMLVIGSMMLPAFATFGIQCIDRERKDGSLFSDSPSATAGGLVRDDRGEWTTGFSIKLGAVSITVAELLGLRPGLYMAWDKRIPCLLVEIDSLVILNLVESASSRDHSLGNIDEVLFLLAKPWEIKIQHINRERNNCADFLAKAGIDRERQALLKFKEDLGDVKGVLSSWESDQDCCKWREIRCDIEANHVTALDFSRLIDSARRATFTDFIGHLSRLKYLDLSGDGVFVGAIPQQLGNLSKLQHLDLRGSYDVYSTNLDWLYTLHSLEYLDLTSVNLSRVTNWLPALAKIPSLRELHLRDCDLPEILLSTMMNFSSLSVLDLSFNHLSPHSIYSWIFNLSSSISYVDLSSNSLQGPIPDAFRNIPSLSYLDMSFNQIEGGIPRFFGNLSLLQTLNLTHNNLYGSIPEDIGNLFNLNLLDMSHNQLSGTLPESIGRFSNLEFLYLGFNHLEGIISEVHLFNLSLLREMDLCFNSFQFKISSGFVPPFQLESILLANCTQGPQFPEWLRTQHNFSDIDISRAQISDTIPAWFWDLSSTTLVLLNFSYNQIYGVLLDLTSKISGSSVVDLSSNNLEGPLPLLPSSILTLHLFQNSFSGSLESLCNSGDFSYLDVSDNFLTGEVPNCFQHIGSSFKILNLANNNLSGSIFPVGPQCYLESLNLRNNNFDGEFPQSLRSCRGLRVIDLGKNKLSGSVPAWIGDNWPSLVVLSLRSNELYGEIPSSICHMTELLVSNSAPNGDLTLQVVKNCLLNEESRRKEQAFSTEQNALVTENFDRRGRNKNRGPQHQREKSRGKSKFKGDFKCHYCGGPNHYERDCRKKKRDQKNGNNENKKDDKDTTAVATDGDVVIICDDACVSSSCQETDWIIDSGASYHITPHRDMFTSYTSGNFGRVRMANHGVTEVIGMGNINLETDTGCRLILRDVRHIPDIRLNIISTGKLDDDGYVSHFGEGKWKLTKGSLITAKGKKKNSLYLMQAKLSNGESERRESFQEVPDDLDPVPSRTTWDHGGDVQDEQNDITDDEPVDDQVPPIQTDDPVPLPEATLDKVHTDDNGADMLTKSLPREKLEVCKSEAGLVVPPT
ncbi:hypothetical protein BUALT_BualtUnG0024400 [Buddleja alternifolia]|uniref:CCHC-type domain-containing protein n=1 Tax=Buddleja alternifolia TaxID=168488 RepID=A0AAV6W0Z3_9LAMI|nr:hypothetical protein BUALT_BualtUnG0024400 [Buddleja alternifolia]